MNPDFSELPENDIPSFQDIVEEDLGRENVRGARVPGRPAMIAEQVIMQWLPQYDCWEFLGAGGMGVVYKARHRELLRWAAIKFLPPDQMGDPRAMARFQNEASLLAQLRHPSIVPVHDFGSRGELAWLVMDFVDGVSLQDWAAEQSRKPAEVARMVAKIARAVGVAHAAGITHRDLKPANILVRGDDPVLLDFGLAQTQNWQQDIRLTQMGELAGTVAYLAPEQVQPSLGEASPSTDVHACAVILFELLAGRLPRTGLASQIIARLHEDVLPPRLSNFVKPVRKELDAICWRALQRKPEDRYANGISLAEDLERFLDGRPVRAKNPDMLDMALWCVRRYPWAIAIGVVAFMALIIAGWSSQRMLWSHEKARLLSQINDQLTETVWTAARMDLTDDMLKRMHKLDTVLERHLHEDTVNRTHNALITLMDAPRLSEEESAQVPRFLGFLAKNHHPQGDVLRERWQSRTVSWQAVASLQEPITREAALKVFRPEGWDCRKGFLVSVPSRPDQTWSTLYSRIKVAAPVELEAEFDETWQEAKACGINLTVPWLKDVRFTVFQAERFAQYQVNFENAEKAPVMAILSDSVPLVYTALPREVRESRHLTLRCRYENGELSMAVNGHESLRYTAVSGLTRPLIDAHFSVLLPMESSLSRLTVRRRHSEASPSPISAADDLVSTGKASQAVSIYEKYLNREDIKSECLFKYATCLLTLKKTSDALVNWEEAARREDEPWKSLAMLQLWRTHLTEGNMASANAWFDLLMAGHPPDLVRTGIPTDERQQLGQYYLPATRSLNCLKARPEDMVAVERAVRVQQFLGMDPRETAVNTALAFHFTGQDQQARQILAQAVATQRPSVYLSAGDMHRTMVCLDHWCALGNADKDTALQAALASWGAVMPANPVPAAAVLRLEKVRRELRRNPQLKPGHLKILQAVTADPSILLRHRLEAALIMDLGGSFAGLRERGKALAILILDAAEGAPDYTLQQLHAELVARSLTQSWTAEQASEWLTTFLGKSRPIVSRERWVGPTVQALTGDSLARALNQCLLREAGQRLARDYILRSRSARDLAHEGMRLILGAVFCEGAGLTPGDALAQESAAKMVTAFCSGEFSEVSLMQFFLLWSGVKTDATWDMLAHGWQPPLRAPLSSLLAKRYQMLGRSQEAAEFTVPLEKEKPAPETTRAVSPTGTE